MLILLLMSLISFAGTAGHDLPPALQKDIDALVSKVDDRFYDDEKWAKEAEKFHTNKKKPAQEQILSLTLADEAFEHLKKYQGFSDDHRKLVQLFLNSKSLPGFFHDYSWNWGKVAFPRMNLSAYFDFVKIVAHNRPKGDRLLAQYVTHRIRDELTPPSHPGLIHVMIDTTLMHVLASEKLIQLNKQQVKDLEKLEHEQIQARAKITERHLTVKNKLSRKCSALKKQPNDLFDYDCPDYLQFKLFGESVAQEYKETAPLAKKLINWMNHLN